MSDEIKKEETQPQNTAPIEPSKTQAKNKKAEEIPTLKPLHERLAEEEKPQRKSPKFNIYWLYAIILAALIGSTMYNGGLKPETAKLSEQEVKENMLLQGDIEQLDVVKIKDVVRVYIKSDSIKKPFYAKRFPKSKFSADKIKGIAIFEYEIGDAKTYSKEIEIFCKEHNIATPKVVNITDQDFLSPGMTSIVTMIIMIGAMVLLMRKMSGGGSGGGPGGIFNIGKSKATLFDKGTKVNINFGDVAGLDEAKVEVMEIVDFLKPLKNIQH